MKIDQLFQIVFRWAFIWIGRVNRVNRAASVKQFIQCFKRVLLTFPETSLFGVDGELAPEQIPVDPVLVSHLVTRERV